MYFNHNSNQERPGQIVFEILIHEELYNVAQSKNQDIKFSRWSGFRSKMCRSEHLDNRRTKEHIINTRKLHVTLGIHQL